MKLPAWLIPALAAVALAILPAVLTPYTQDLVVKIALYAIFALSLELLVGMTGLVSLGHAAFLGMGAYVAVLGAGDASSPAAVPLLLASITAAAVFPVELTGLGVFLAGLRRRKKLGTQKMRLLAVILFSLGILGLTGCGCPSTVFQTYTINIRATSVSFTAPAQSTSVILSVGNQ